MSDFCNIWMPYADRFYRAAYYLLESESDAEDAVQELYLKLWSARSSLKDVRKPSAYGLSMLKNICIDRIRRRSARQTEPLEKAPPVEDGPSQNPIEARDTLRFLLNEMEKLPQKQRDVLKMRVIDRLEYEDISKRTGLSQVYVRVLVAAARKTLKSKL